MCPNNEGKQPCDKKNGTKIKYKILDCKIYGKNNNKTELKFVTTMSLSNSPLLTYFLYQKFTIFVKGI